MVYFGEIGIDLDHEHIEKASRLRVEISIMYREWGLLPI